MKKYRLAILTSHPIQYQAPLWRRLAQDPQIDLTVYFLSDQGAVEYLDPEFCVKFRWDTSLLEGYRHKFLSKTHGSTNAVVPAIRVLIADLKRYRYDALVVHGYTHWLYWLTFLSAWLIGVPIFLRGTSTLLDQPPLVKRALKAIMLRFLIRKAAACLYLGTCNKQFYRHYGADERRLFFTPHVVENAFFNQQAKSLRGQKYGLRKRFGIEDEDPVVLFCGKLIPKKQPLHLLKAFARIRREHRCHLLYVGEGVLRKDIEREVAQKGIPDVHFAGFLNQSAIGEAYAIADLLVLPSLWGETWGLVVNEAMNFSLPIVVSDKVGAAYDLVRQGVNGYIVPAGDVKALAEAITDLITDEEKRNSFGRKSAEIIEGWSIDAHIRGIVQALQATVGK